MPTNEELSDRLDALEARVDDLSKALMDEKVESLRARIEELEVQMNLGAKDARDQLAPVVDQLRNRFLDLRALVDQAGSAATSAAGDLRGRLEDTASKIRPGS